MYGLPGVEHVENLLGLILGHVPADRLETTHGAHQLGLAQPTCGIRMACENSEKTFDAGNVLQTGLFDSFVTEALTLALAVPREDRARIRKVELRIPMFYGRDDEVNFLAHVQR